MLVFTFEVQSAAGVCNKVRAWEELFPGVAPRITLRGIGRLGDTDNLATFEVTADGGHRVSVYGKFVAMKIARGMLFVEPVDATLELREIPNEGTSNHDVRGDSAGWFDRPRLTCVTCQTTLVRQPHETLEQWSAQWRQFLTDHPNDSPGRVGSSSSYREEGE